MTSALVEQDDFLKSLTVEPVKRNENSFTDKSFLVFITVPVHISELGIERSMHGERFQSYLAWKNPSVSKATKALR